MTHVQLQVRIRETPLTIEEIFRDRSKGSIFERAFMILGQVRELDTEYRPWRKLRPIARDAGLDPVDAWAAAKFLRSSDFRAISLYTSNFGRFGYSEGRYLAESLHRIDRAFGGGGAASLEHGMLSDDAHRTRLRIRTLMDEAAESSLIEGAATTRKDAIELLRSRRDAKTKGERMVMNNFAAMQQIKQWRDRPLSPEMLREPGHPHGRNTQEPGGIASISTPGRACSCRARNHWRGHPHATTGREPARPRRALCAFANKVHKGAEFIHPIVKASILHFMIGYDHPFVDGNGRTARAVFYWYALRQGY